jgi:hypothetical protein
LIQETTRELDAVSVKKNKYYGESDNFYDRGRDDWDKEKEGLNIQYRWLNQEGNKLENEMK